MCNKHGFHLIVLLVACAFLLGFASSSAASMAKYENLPPFAKTDVQSNVLLVMDYSGSMQSQAYYGTDWHGYPHTKVGNYGDCGYYKCEVSEPYDHSNSYYGYYDSSKYYYHDGNKWIAYESSSETGVGDKSELSGNFLNWLVMTRIDLSLKALIGGKAKECDGDTCTLKPQGAKREIEISNLNCVAEVRPKDYGNWNEDYENVMLIDMVDSGGTCEIGTFTDREANVEIKKENRQGIVQNNFDSIRFGFITFAGSDKGSIKHPVHDSNMTELISSLESEIPYGGTPTGQAMWEASNYLRQVTSFTDEDNISHDYEDNDEYINKNSTIDPYFKTVNSNAQPAWCRKSFVVLVSDGVWNQGVDPVKPAHKMHTDDLRDLKNNQTAKVYSLFAFSDDKDGENSMKTVSMYGNFQDDQNCDDENWPYPKDEYPEYEPSDDEYGSKDLSFPLSACDPNGNYGSCCEEWDEKDGNGIPDAYYSAESGSELQSSLAEIFSDIREETSSGTSVASLTEERTSGSLVNQAIFFPEKVFDEQKVSWIGYLYTYWFLNKSNIQNLREDTENNKALDIKKDYILEFTSSQGDLKIEAYNSSTNGSRDTHKTTYNRLDLLTPVWEAGAKLRDRNASDRRILAVSNATSDLGNFTANNVDQFKAFFGDDESLYPDGLVNGSQPEYSELIRYVRGEDISATRSRCTGNGTWKLGDIVHSTPTTVNYGDYSLVFTGANDGMLHAFRMGKLKRQKDNLQPVRVQNAKFDTGIDKLGREEWAFIPRSSMPYLRFLAHPNYSHINTVDLKPYVIEKQDSDKKILIGGMRFGGATGAGDSKNPDVSSVNPPSDTCDPVDGNDCVGRSAYFALDITDPKNPKHLWSFSPPGLGFSYSGPAYIKRKDSSGNWQHYVLFASGPTSFEGASSQSLRFFVLDLESGPSNSFTYPTDVASGNTPDNTFGGRLFTNGLDVNGDGQTDYVNMGYSQIGSQGYSGGMYNIWTGGEDLQHDPDPSAWNYNKNFINLSTNPIVAKVASMKCFGQWYIYFGTGQYFTREGREKDKLNHLYGVPFTCKADTPCQDTINNAHDPGDVNCEDIYMQSDVTNPNKGTWTIELDGAENDPGFLRERSYANPSVTSFDTVLFNTSMPTSKVCEFGGKSRAWARNCAAGWAMSEEKNCSQFAVDTQAFKYLVQLSGGDIKQYSPDDFTDGPVSGVTPTTPGVVSSEGGVPMVGASGSGEIILWIEK